MDAELLDAFGDRMCLQHLNVAQAKVQLLTRLQYDPFLECYGAIALYASRLVLARYHTQQLPAAVGAAAVEAHKIASSQGVAGLPLLLCSGAAPKLTVKDLQHLEKTSRHLPFYPLKSATSATATAPPAPKGDAAGHPYLVVTPAPTTHLYEVLQYMLRSDVPSASRARLVLEVLCSSMETARGMSKGGLQLQYLSADALAVDMEHAGGSLHGSGVYTQPWQFSTPWSLLDHGPSSSKPRNTSKHPSSSSSSSSSAGLASKDATSLAQATVHPARTPALMGWLLATILGWGSNAAAGLQHLGGQQDLTAAATFLESASSVTGAIGDLISQASTDPGIARQLLTQLAAAAARAVHTDKAAFAQRLALFDTMPPERKKAAAAYGAVLGDLGAGPYIQQLQQAWEQQHADDPLDQMIQLVQQLLGQLHAPPSAWEQALHDACQSGEDGPVTCMDWWKMQWLTTRPLQGSGPGADPHSSSGGSGLPMGMPASLLAGPAAAGGGGEAADPAADPAADGKEGPPSAGQGQRRRNSMDSDLDLDPQGGSSKRQKLEQGSWQEGALQADGSTGAAASASMQPQLLWASSPPAIPEAWKEGTTFPKDPTTAVDSLLQWSGAGDKQQLEDRALPHIHKGLQVTLQYLVAHTEFVSAIARDLTQALASVPDPDVAAVLLRSMATVATLVSLDTGYVCSAVYWNHGAAAQEQQQLPSELLSQLSHSNVQQVLDASCGAGFVLRRMEDLQQAGNKKSGSGTVHKVQLGGVPCMPPVKQAPPGDDAFNTRLMLVIPDLPAAPAPPAAAAEGAGRPRRQPPPPPVQLSRKEWVTLVTAAITWLLTAVTPLRFGRPLPPAAAFGDKVAWACAVQAAWVNHLPLISPYGWQPVLGQRASNERYQEQQQGGKEGKKNGGGPQCAEVDDRGHTKSSKGGGKRGRKGAGKR